MNCYDCARHQTTTAAVAICHECGAAVCPDHAVTTPHQLTRVVPLGRLVPVEPAARIVRCTTCAAAVRATTRRDAVLADPPPATT